MVPGILLALVARPTWKLHLDRGEADSSDRRRYLEVNVIFYASAVLGLWFFWNWFAKLILGRRSIG